MALTLRLPALKRSEPSSSIFAEEPTVQSPIANVGGAGLRVERDGERALAGAGQLEARRATACAAAAAGSGEAARKRSEDEAAKSHKANPTAAAGNADPNTGS